MRYTAWMLLALAACGPSRGGGNNNGAHDLAGQNNFGDMGGPPTGDCSDAAKLIYVVDSDGTFSSFAPNQMDVTRSVFTRIGSLSCPAATGAQPFSMSVDRNATAWVLYVAEADPVFGTPASTELFQVDTSNAACTRTTFGASNGFTEFGMGFVTNSATTTDETLFIAGGGPQTDPLVIPPTKLGSLDITALSTAIVATLDGRPELTGTGDAKLWGFFPDTTRPRIAQLDKSAGSESTPIALSSLAGQPEAWAFAFWGGDFWVFLKRTTDANTIVYHVTSTGAVTNWPTSGRRIVGAGVSTCAPTGPVF